MNQNYKTYDGNYKKTQKNYDTIILKLKKGVRFIMYLYREENYEKMSRRAANIISAQVICKPDSVLGLATGSSPLGIYKQLIEWYNKGDIDFSKVTSVNLDEYCGLAPTHDQSYRYFMDTNFFDHINIDKFKTFVPNGLTEDWEHECSNYDKLIENLGGIDLQLLGIGFNGHIGFNEPSDHFDIHTRRVELTPSTIEANSRFFPNGGMPTHALTMGLKPILSAKSILLIAGPEKYDIVKRAFTGPVTPEVPASILQLHNNVTVVYTGEKDF